MDRNQNICRFVQLSRDRLAADLDSAASRGLHFDVKAADRAVKFFSLLRHSKGEWNGQHFVLEPWQEHDIIRPLFGWKRADGSRRFRAAYIEMPRKNGKTTLGAGIANKLFLDDDEAGAEVYIAATKRDQAKICHEEAKAQIRGLMRDDPRLHSHVTINRDNLSIASTRCKLEPLSADSDTMDGLNVHGAIVDEIHKHKTSEVWEVLETGTGARRQPLIVGITTAGFDRHSICWTLHEYATRILEGQAKDDTFFAYIASMDAGDDWQDKSVWGKANPNLGVTVKLDDLERKLEKARELPRFQNEFRRLHLCEWTEQCERWLDMNRWDACGEDVSDEYLKGRVCYGGLDLAQTTDTTAFVLVFPMDDGRYVVKPFFFVPESNARERSKRDRVPYNQWAKEGFLELTAGEATDYGFVRRRILECSELYDLKEVAYDPWSAFSLAQQLEAENGLVMVKHRQGFISMSEPSKTLERFLLEKSLVHDGNPVLRWHAANATIRTDPAGNIKPDKENSTERIDGIVALIMAIGRATVQVEAECVLGSVR